MGREYPDISESGFSFVFIAELLERWKERCYVPTLFSPTQREEKKAGYDARVMANGIPVFFQFKRSTFCDTPTNDIQIELKGPFYYFWLYGKNFCLQHKTLVQLAKTCHYVYYIAPLFVSQVDFEKYQMTSSVVKNSSFLPLSAMAEVTGTRH